MGLCPATVVRLERALHVDPQAFKRWGRLWSERVEITPPLRPRQTRPRVRSSLTCQWLYQVPDRYAVNDTLALVKVILIR